MRATTAFLCAFLSATCACSRFDRGDDIESSNGSEESTAISSTTESDNGSNDGFQRVAFVSMKLDHLVAQQREMLERARPHMQGASRNESSTVRSNDFSVSAPPAPRNRPQPHRREVTFDIDQEEKRGDTNVPAMRTSVTQQRQPGPFSLSSGRRDHSSSTVGEQGLPKFRPHFDDSSLYDALSTSKSGPFTSAPHDTTDMPFPSLLFKRGSETELQKNNSKTRKTTDDADATLKRTDDVFELPTHTTTQPRRNPFNLGANPVLTDKPTVRIGREGDSSKSTAGVPLFRFTADDNEEEPVIQRRRMTAENTSKPSSRNEHPATTAQDTRNECSDLANIIEVFSNSVREDAEASGFELSEQEVNLLALVESRVALLRQLAGPKGAESMKGEDAGPKALAQLASAVRDVGNYSIARPHAAAWSNLSEFLDTMMSESFTSRILALFPKAKPVPRR